MIAAAIETMIEIEIAGMKYMMYVARQAPLSALGFPSLRPALACIGGSKDAV
jgi:hypothetical protein